MFTGLVEGIGKIKKRDRKRVLFECPKNFAIKAGDSISVDGVCLTAVESTGDGFWAELSDETLERTTLKEKRENEKVNLERALALGERLGGHLVLGHIDGVGRVVSVKKKGEGFVEMEIMFPEELSRYIVEKGSIAVDGVSLTVNKVKGDKICLMLIPETLRRTTLSLRKPGDRVNLEVDLIAKYVERMISANKSESLLNKLKDEGYL